MRIQLLRASKLFALLLSISFTTLFTACKDDEEERPQLGTVVVDGETHRIEHGAVLRDKTGELSSATEEQIYFHNINLAGPNDVGFSVTLVSAGTELESGQYVFQSHDWNHQASPGEVTFCLVTLGSTQLDEMSAGAVTVSRNGDSYNVQGTAVVNGKSFVFSFNGKMQIV